MSKNVFLGLKYFVERTKVGKNLPIYTEYRSGGNNCFTLIKRISGDTVSLSADLAEYFASLNNALKISKNAVKSAEVSEKNEIMNRITKKWRIRNELGHIWVHGKHTEIVRKFLELKGF